MRYAAKFDASQLEITKGLRKLGWWFQDVARHPGLGYDILTRHRDGFPLFLEVKNPGPPSSQKLTESEQAMLDAFPQFFRIVYSLDHALEAIGLAK